MAIPAPTYRVVSLPDGIPECLKGSPASFSNSRPGGGTGSSFSFGEQKKSTKDKQAFDPSKALKGAGSINDDKEYSACRTRGDGLFDGGSTFKRE